ncbi:rod shape-determining protein RodA [Gammaproteobacteria bacterium]|nr:rod shape-determining protein RodA [Gammaproteobacteria bacterium]
MKNYLFQRIDPILLFLVGIAVLFGGIVLISANQGQLGLLIKQLVRALPAILALVILYRISKRELIELTPWLYLGSIVLLILVLALGYMTNGAQRWLNLGLFKFEPSEFLKVTLPLMLGRVIAAQGIPIRFSTLISCIVLVMIPFVLILKQPDLGTSLVIAAIGGLVIFLSGLSRKWIVTGIVLFLALSPIAWTQLHDYQKQRIITLINPEQDLKHHGYHIHQSKVAIGSGGAFGMGIMRGEQVQLGFLPEHHTDFVFAMICEELGFLGSSFWMLLVLSLGIRSIMLGDLQHCIFSKVSCIALGCNFLINAWVNMAMVTGMIPVVGIPLPLISYGGTSFVMNLIGFGIILKLGNINPKQQGAW